MGVHWTVHVYELAVYAPMVGACVWLVMASLSGLEVWVRVLKGLYVTSVLPTDGQSLKKFLPCKPSY